MSGEMSTNNTQKICGLCNDKTSKYCCPRCEVLYCSLDCYKSEKHMSCSENFYRDCVTEEISSYNNDDESKRKMMEILKRMHNSDAEGPKLEDLLEDVSDNDMDSDDEEVSDLHDRIKDLNLDNADAVWNALTEDEKNDFEALLSQGDVGSILPQWQPWWAYRKNDKLVQDVSKKDTVEEEALKSCPVVKHMPKLSSITTIQPSLAIKFNITNVLASYAFLIRYFNGELEPVEGTTCLLNICANLDFSTNFEDAVTAMESVAQRCLQSELIETDKLSLNVMKQDTFLIVQGPSKENKLYYCKAALSHLHSTLSEAKSTSRKQTKTDEREKSVFTRKFPEHKRDHLPLFDVSKVKKCLKKLEYYLSFIESFGMEL